MLGFGGKARQIRLLMKRTGGNGGEEKIRDVKMVRFGKTWE